MIHESVTVYDAGAYLCPKLDPGFRLASDNGAEMRLVDAYNAVGAGADVLLEHHLLLLEHFECRFEASVVMSVETREEICGMPAEEIKKCLKVSLQATYLHLFGLADEFLALALFLGQLEERLAGFHAVRLWFLCLVASAELVKQAVYQLAAVFQKI